MRDTYIEIDQQALAHNVQCIRQLVKEQTPRVLAMVKANAYGHGLGALEGLMQADGFGVATLQEGLQVFHYCQNKQSHKMIVLIEGVFDKEEWHTAIQHDFSVVIHHQAQLEWALDEVVANHSSYSRTIWLKYNTGMSRLGFDKKGVIQAAKALTDKGYHIILTSHFACSDDKNHPQNAKQIHQFDTLLTWLKQHICLTIMGSLCNSAGIVNFKQAHYDWVRAGIALYGDSPVIDKTCDDLGLHPVMHFYAKIIAVHQLQAGQSVGYGALWTASSPARIGVVGVGYGDGYPRVVQGAWVVLHQHQKSARAKIIGRVAMDMLMIDLSDLPEFGLGDKVELWGNCPTVAQIAQCANTISYELLCKITQRPQRRQINQKP